MTTAVRERRPAPAPERRRPAPPGGSNVRLTFLALLCVSLFVLLVARLWYLQVVTGDQFVARAEGQAIREIPITAARGDILDAQGRVLVETRYAQVVSVRPDEMGEDEDRILTDLATLLGTTVADLRAQLDPRGGAAPQPVAFDVDPDIVVFLHENRATRFPGVYVERLPLRDYPHGQLAAHVLGYTGEISAEQLEQPEWEGYESGDLIGWSGLEASWEDALRGQDGFRSVRVDARGEVIGEVSERAPVAGDALQLTLDLDAQRVAEEALAEGIGVARVTGDREGGIGRGGTFAAPGGAVVVLDATTGEVAAMASYPTFAPAGFVGGISRPDWQFLQDEANHFPLINRAISAAYPPGSVFKIVSAAAALEHGFANERSSLPCPASYEWKDNVYRNWRDTDSGHLSLAQSLQQSCDTVYYYLARQMFNREIQVAGEDAPPDAYYEFIAETARQFGFDERLGIDLPGEVGGVIPGRVWREDYWESAREGYCTQALTAAPGTYAAELFFDLCNYGGIWRGGDLVNMSIGQGDVQTTPLQVATSFAAIANQGTIMRPHVVRAVLGTSGQVTPVAPEVVGQVPLTPEHLDLIEDGLVMVTGEDGTACLTFCDFPVAIAAKTGTAENKPRQPYAWFAGYNVAPVDGRRFVVLALVEEGGGGSLTAAPIVKRVFEGLLGLDETAITVGEVTD